MGKMICFKDMFGLFDTIPNIVEQADEWAFLWQHMLRIASLEYKFTRGLFTA